MSRENDLKALRQLKSDMEEANAFAELAKEEWDKCNEYKAQIDNAKFVFTPLSVNNEETAKAGFIQQWKNKYGNISKFKLIFLIFYSVLMLAFSVYVFVDLLGQNGWVFKETDFLYDDNTAVEMLLIYGSSLVFFLSSAFLPWFHIKGRLNGTFVSVLKLMIGGFIIGGVFFYYTASNTDTMWLLYAFAVAPVIAVIIGFVIHIVFLIISKIPHLSAKQKAVLEAERMRDINNAEKNKINRVKEEEEWQKNWAVEREELKQKMLLHLSQGDTAMERAKAHLKAAEECDVLGENEKSPEVIDCLVHFIESRRADNIKEALHEYDIMVQNQKLIEIEAIKATIEIEKAKKENADRQYAMEMNRRHQIEMEAQARRNADIQSQIAANTAAAAASAERLRRDMAGYAADAAATQARVASDIDAMNRRDYYNS